MKAVVLAAGQGKRMQPLTNSRPKALVELKGKPLLWHVLRSLEKTGVEEAIIVVGFLAELVKQHFGEKFGKMHLSYVEQRIPMGTAHALLQAKKKIRGKCRFLAASCDVIVEPALWKKLSKAGSFDAVVALRKEENTENFGVALVSGKRLEQIVEKPLGRIESNLVNAGCYAFSEKIFAALRKTKISERGEFELTDTINALAAKKRAGFVLCKGKCLDIGTIEDLQAAEKS